MAAGKLQTLPIGIRKKFRLTVCAVAIDRPDCMDDIACIQAAGRGNNGPANRAGANCAACGHDFRPAGAMNRAVYPAAACQTRVGGINNRVNRYARYISLLQLDRRIHNRDPHAAIPVRFM
jgi:hypothetical protein